MISNDEVFIKKKFVMSVPQFQKKKLKNQPKKKFFFSFLFQYL
jgi:hypothetical protein